MTNEEKLDKLTDRVDAIARNLELLSGMQIETERRMQRMAEVVNNVGAITESLIEAVRNHEVRLSDLEA